MNWIKTALAILTISLLGSVFVGASSQATSISAPFDSGSSWYICQGYNGPVTHSGTSSLSLDFTKQLCDGGAQSNASSAGANVRAPLDGTVYWYGPAYGSMCINTLDNRSIGLTHINSSLKAGNTVTQNQIVGTIGSAGTVGNGGIAHLHMQMWSTANCIGEQIPFDSAYNAKICGAPDMPVLGPNYYNNGTWSGILFIAEACNSTNPPVYRMYSTVTKKHLFTADSNEVLTLQKSSWRYEGVAYSVKSLSACNPNESIYRFYSEQLKTHLYTIDENEKSHIIANYPSSVWRYEGVGFCASAAMETGTKPVYRFYSEQLKSHLFTVDEYEKDTIIGWNDPSVWRYEGVAYYAKSN